MTTPNTPTPYGGQPADGNVNEDQPTMPMPVAPPQDEQPQAGGNTTERRYALAPQQLFRAIHDQLTTGATFTLDHEDVQSGIFAFHSFDGAGDLDADRGGDGFGNERAFQNTVQPQES